MLNLRLAAVSRNGFEYLVYLRIQQWIALTVEFHFRDDWKQNIRHGRERADIHVTPTDSGTVQMFLAAEELAAKIALVGQSQVDRQRWRNARPAALQQGPAVRMSSPAFFCACDASTLPNVER